MTVTENDPSQWLYVVPLALLMSLMVPSMTLLAQGVDSEVIIESLIDGDVETDSAKVADREQAVIAAIENTASTLNEVQKLFNVGKISIVFVSDANLDKGTIAEAVAEYSQEIDDLRVAIEASALLYHAIESRNVAVTDIIAVEILEDSNVRLYVAGEPPQ
jgi:hypothetical protein